MREWRDIHAQLQTLRVVARARLAIRTKPDAYEQIHRALLAGLLGNIGCKSDEDDGDYLGARGIKFWRPSGLDWTKKPGRWIVAAELVETTRLYARGIAAIEPEWLRGVAGHLLKTHAARAALGEEGGAGDRRSSAPRCTACVYSNRRVDFGTIDPAAAREIFIREALVEGELETRAAVLRAQPQAGRAGRGARAQVAPPGRAGRRRADLRLLRPAVPARRAQRRGVRALVREDAERASRSCCS